MIRNVDIKVRNIGENPVNTHINRPKMPKQNSSIFYIVSYQKSNILFTVYLTAYSTVYLTVYCISDFLCMYYYIYVCVLPLPSIQLEVEICSKVAGEARLTNRQSDTARTAIYALLSVRSEGVL